MKAQEKNYVQEILNLVMTAREAEEKYNLGNGTVSKAVKAKRLEARYSGRALLVSSADVQRLWGKR